MRIFLSILLVVTGLSECLFAQIFPKEHSKLNFRIIGFSVPLRQPGCTYQLQIARGVYVNVDSFRKNIFFTTASNENKIVAEVPFFGQEYTWRMVYKSMDSSKSKGPLRHFSTGMVTEIDSSFYRLKVIKEAEKYTDAYVFLDNVGVLYDMKGHPVWYLPANLSGQRIHPLDIKMSQYGTITFLQSSGAWEINYNGDILWKMIDTATGEHPKAFHHGLTKLSNGHYMLLSNEKALWSLPASYRRDSGSSKDIKVSNGVLCQEMVFGTVIEYDGKSDKVWSWSGSQYFKESDLYNKRDTNGLFSMQPHLNSFYFDEENGFIYLSYKNISRILKVKYPEGTIVAAYGTKYKQGYDELANGMFCQQHSCNKDVDGDLYLYNNNTCTVGAAPKIIIMKEPVTANTMPEKTWEYQCAVDDTADVKVSAPYIFQGGGNAIMLAGKSVFVSMGAPYSKVFIVDHDKHVIWSAIAMKRDGIDQDWKAVDLYRASIIISRKEMETLIWNAQKDHFLNQ